MGAVHGRVSSWLLLALAAALMIGGCGKLSWGELKQALEADGLKVTFTDRMGPEGGEFLINDDVRLSFAVAKNERQAEALRQSHAENAQSKQYVVHLYVVKNMKIAVSPSTKNDAELEQKIERTILKLNGDG